MVFWLQGGMKKVADLCSMLTQESLFWKLGAFFCTAVQPSRLDIPDDVMDIQAFIFILVIMRTLTVVPFFVVFLDRENSMPQQQYWLTDKMKVSSLGKNLSSRVASSRKTLQR